MCWCDVHSACIARHLLAHDNSGCCYSLLCLLTLLDGMPHYTRLWLTVLCPAVDVNQSEVVLLCAQLRRDGTHTHSNTQIRVGILQELHCPGQHTHAHTYVHVRTMHLMNALEGQSIMRLDTGNTFWLIHYRKIS